MGSTSSATTYRVLVTNGSLSQFQYLFRELLEATLRKLSVIDAQGRERKRLLLLKLTMPMHRSLDGQTLCAGQQEKLC